jgi:hypothetical protein
MLYTFGRYNPCLMNFRNFTHDGDEQGIGHSTFNNNHLNKCFPICSRIRAGGNQRDAPRAEPRTRITPGEQ